MIKKFTFRLDSVLRHRASMKELRERELAEIEAQLIKERRVLEELTCLREEILLSLADLQKASFARLERDLYEHYWRWLETEIHRQREHISQVEMLRDMKLSELVRASQDQRIVEILKEKQFADYAKTVAKAEQSVLDEVAANAFARGLRQLGAVEENAA